MSVQKVRPVKQAKKGLFHILFSRVMIVLVLLLIQIGIFVAMLTWLSEYSIYIRALFMVIEIVSVIWIINGDSNPGFKITWILLILIVPFFGTLFYLFMKLMPGAGKIKRRLKRLTEHSKEYMQQNRDVLEALRLSKPANANLAHYFGENLSFPIHRNTEVTYFPSGEMKFEALKKQLDQAEQYIFMEYFIIEEGLMWDEILEILVRKAKAGVDVRFLYDGTCSMLRVPFRYDKKLRKMGIQTRIFSPIRPVISSYQNNRDHRKICVIDGKVAFTGGVNLADEYINERELFGCWKDTAIMLKGEAVQNLTILFLQMWEVFQRKPDDFSRYLTPKSEEIRRELGFVLPYGDSPFDHEDAGKQVYLHILNHAKKYVHIMTPYLILDNEMITALTYASKSGIEVVIIMPHIPDKWYAFVLAKTYYQELLEAGVQIYEYTPGFVHAKVFVSDNDTATVGTINLDYRSLYHNFECGTFIYNNPAVWEVERDFQATLSQCEKITIAHVKGRNILERFIGSVMRLIAPLM